MTCMISISQLPCRTCISRDCGTKCFATLGSSRFCLWGCAIDASVYPGSPARAPGPKRVAPGGRSSRAALSRSHSMLYSCAISDSMLSLSSGLGGSTVKQSRSTCEIHDATSTLALVKQGPGEENSRERGSANNTLTPQPRY